MPQWIVGVGTSCQLWPRHHFIESWRCWERRLNFAVRCSRQQNEPVSELAFWMPSQGTCKGFWMPSQGTCKGDQGWCIPSSLVKTLALNLKNNSTSCQTEHCGESSSWLPTEVDERRRNNGYPRKINSVVLVHRSIMLVYAYIYMCKKDLKYFSLAVGISVVHLGSEDGLKSPPPSPIFYNWRNVQNVEIVCSLQKETLSYYSGFLTTCYLHSQIIKEINIFRIIFPSFFNVPELVWAYSHPLSCITLCAHKVGAHFAYFKVYCVRVASIFLVCKALMSHFPDPILCNMTSHDCMDRDGPWSVSYVLVFVSS